MHTGEREGVEGGTSCTPSKDFEKFGHKNAIKHEKREPPSKEFENDCASM
jgi:hypothetical protein